MIRHQRLRISAYLWAPLCALIVGCAPERGQDQVEQSGEQLFEERCGACHGTARQPPSVTELRELPSDRLREAMRNHPAAGELPTTMTASNIADVIEYLEQSN